MNFYLRLIIKFIKVLNIVEILVIFLNPKTKEDVLIKVFFG